MIDLVLRKNSGYGQDLLLIQVAELRCPEHDEPLVIHGDGTDDYSMWASCPKDYEHNGKSLDVRVDWQYEPTNEYRRSYP